MRALAVVRDSGLPDAWIGAGVLRDLVWGRRYGHGFDLLTARDVDVAFFDPADLSRDNDQRATALLAALEPGLPWEAKNQAAVHTWYPDRFGGEPVSPLHGIVEAVATWPEYATAVAIQRHPDERSTVCAPHGLDDLLDGVCDATPPGSANGHRTNASPVTARPTGGCRQDGGTPFLARAHGR